MAPERSPARSAPMGVRLGSGQAARADAATRRNSALTAAAAAVLLMTAPDALGAELWSDSDGVSVRWDNTLQQTEAFRGAPVDQALVAGINADDGDRRFTGGLVADRSEIFSELDADAGSFGARVSVAAWVDPIYLSSHGGEDPATFNPVSVPPGQFPSAVKQLQGLHAELFDAFVHENGSVDNVPVNVRLGRYTLLWGESLFFGGNGIASGQGPLDILRSREIPDSTAKDLFLPVAQASISVQLGAGLSLEAYDQFEWRPDRLPGVSTFFSTTDIAGVGAERLLVPNGTALLRQSDRSPSGVGQFGLALRGSAGQTDWGVYALRAGERDPLLQIDPGTERYRLLYPAGIGIFGASASGFVGANAIAGEMSLHAGVPVGRAGGLVAGDTVPRDDSLNAQASVTSQLAPGRLWDSAQILAELAGNTVLRAPAGVDPASAAGRTTVAVEAQFAPQYFHALPGLDLDPAVTVSYGLTGSSAIDPEFQAGAGAVILSLALVWRTVWHVSVQYTRFVGGPSVQLLADRDFVAISIRRSF